MRLITILILMSFIAIACGQKPGVHVATGTAGSSAGAGGELAPGEEGGVAIDPETGQPVSGGAASGGSGGTSGAGGAGAAGSGAGAVSVKALPGDKNGVTDNAVLLGFHAPLTGAAAVPLVDIQRGVNLYYEWLEDKGVTIHGRKFSTIYRDDQYNPSHAVEVCREMVEQRKVFALIGGAGTDQILACARYAASKGVPYFSAGVTEKVVSGLKNYFALSMSYPDQTDPLSQMIKNYNSGPGAPVLVDRCSDTAPDTTPFCNGGGAAANAKVAIVYSNTEGFYDTRDAFLQNWKKVSSKDAEAFAITKFSMQSTEANSLVSRLKSGGFDVVFINTSPTNWLTILRVAEPQRYAPRWIGVGLTKGINTVAAVGCSQSSNTFSNSLFLNPWMSVDNPSYNSQFAEAWGRYGDGTPFTEHDIAFGLYGLTVSHAALFEASGRDLSRSKFMATLQSLKNVKAPDNTKAGNIIDIFSVLNYTPANHFGASQAHLIYGNCPSGRWSDVPGKQFVSGF